MAVILLAIFISYIFASFFGQLIHWALHQSWTGFLNQAHMSHHLEKYPPEDFTSDTYRSAGGQSTPKYFIILALPVIIGPIVLGVMGILPLSIVLIVLGMEGLMGFLNDRVHEWIHIENHWITRVPVLRTLFTKWFKLHYLHHVDMNKNFGIFTFHWDRLFGTYWEG